MMGRLGVGLSFMHHINVLKSGNSREGKDERDETTDTALSGAVLRHSALSVLSYLLLPADDVI
jgi:hypothetical protein